MNDVTTHIIYLDLNHLPAYAGHLLEHRFKEFVRTLVENSYEAEIPLLQILNTMTEEEIFNLSLESNRRMLTSLKNNQAQEYIETTKVNWVNNQLKIISKDQVIADDIVLVNYVRRKTLRSFIEHYTADLKTAMSLIEEIDRFVGALDGVLFKTYIRIQQGRLQETNKSLEKRESELLEAQALAQIGSFEWDFTGKNSSYTPEVFKIFEFDKTSNLEAFLEDVHPEDRLKLRASIEKAMKDGNYECEYRYHRNKKSKVLFSKGKVYFQSGRPVKMIGTVMDVTERIHFIKTLEEKDELSKQSQALTNTGTWKWTVDQNEISWSDEMYRIHGLEPQSEIITFDRFVSFIHPQWRQKRLTEITEALENGATQDYIQRIMTQDGKEKILRGKSEVLKDASNISIGMFGTCQDITHEYQLSQQLTARNDELARKNKVLESFNFIATHDLQEPLRKIQVYSNRILHDGQTEIPEKFLSSFKKISLSSNRMQRMIEDFMLFYQLLNTERNFENVDLQKALGEIKTEFADKISEKKATIKSSALPPVRGIPIQIKELLKQLISNALKFSQPEVSPEISIVHSFEKRGDGSEVMKLKVKDNGVGFDGKYSERIFDLFQKLHSKDEYPGSGIGLSLCKKIAEDHGGKIIASSEPAAGSEFCVYLPVVKAEDF